MVSSGEASANNFGTTISLRAWLAHEWYCESHERMQKVRTWRVLVAICKVERGLRVHATTVEVHSELVAICKVGIGAHCMHVTTRG